MDRCGDCGKELPLVVMRSAAGWYVGQQCDCGPYDRVTDYVRTKEEAEALLAFFQKLEAE